MFLKKAEFGDVAVATAYLEAFADAEESLPLGIYSTDGYGSWFVSELARRKGEDAEHGSSPSTTYLLIDDDKPEDASVVGHLTVRSDGEDEWCLESAGHFDYAVIPEMRNIGLGTALLEAGRYLLGSGGYDRGVVFCREDNAAARLTIEHNGAVYVGSRKVGSARFRRYYVPTAEACSLSVR